jgi:hypothetical protein
LFEFEQAKIFSKEEEKTTKKKKKVHRIAGRGKNARLFRLTFLKLIKTKTKMDKTNRNTRSGLAVLRCAGLAGRPAKFEFLFWFGVWV